MGEDMAPDAAAVCRAAAAAEDMAPDAAAVCRAAAAAAPPRTLAAARTAYDALLAATFAGDAVECAQEVGVGEVGGIPCRIYRPPTTPIGAVVYAHGGGWVQGSLQGYDGVARQLCGGTGAVVVSVGYRLGPEFAAPAAFEDVMRVVREVALNGVRGVIGGGGAVVVAGDSAGGSLAAAVAIEAGREGVALAGQVLLFPSTDISEGWLGRSGGSVVAHGEGKLLSRRDLVGFARAYAPTLRSDWRVSPALAPEALLRGVAPAVVVSAGHDVLLDDAERYEAALRGAGVPVLRLHWPRQVHIFVFLGRAISDAAPALERICSAVAELLLRGVGASHL